MLKVLMVGVVRTIMESIAGDRDLGQSFLSTPIPIRPSFLRGIKAERAPSIPEPHFQSADCNACTEPYIEKYSPGSEFLRPLRGTDHTACVHDA